METKRRKICTILVDRANYGRLWPVMKEIQQSPQLEFQLICAGTTLLERFGQADQIIEREGFPIDDRVYMEMEGSVPGTMSQSIGVGIVNFTNAFQKLRPDVVLLIGDRYEALAAAIAAAYMNIPIAHIQGGEVSGSIDECARHAITKFAKLHFPATERARQYIIAMGEKEDSVFNYGCPVGDYIRSLDASLDSEFLQKHGVGSLFDVNAAFLLVIYHPVTTEFGTETDHVQQLLKALSDIAMPTIWLWPNIDAGANDISKVIRRYREHNRADWLHLIKNLDPTSFQKCLKGTVCAVGNSSSFIRDSTFNGTPVVLVGSRQVGREYGENLISVKPDAAEICDAVRAQLKHGRYPASSLYGSGGAAAKIVKKIGEYSFPVQKHLDYIYREMK